ncbi:hypothetical protein ABQJ53_17100 [Morganella morganii]|uniref:hypothetical protein n=1 Tax=Morganella morganii TaxID=582 RepID=UPI003F227C7C
MLSPLKSDKDLERKINVPKIKKNLITDMKKEVPEQFRTLVDTFHKNDAAPQKEELLTPVESLIFNDIPLVREIAGKMASDVYGGLIEKIYNILFRNTETEKYLDFDAIKAEARTQAENIIKDKKIPQRNEISVEDTVRQKFESKVNVTSLFRENDLEALFDILNENQSKSNILGQRATLSHSVLSTSSNKIQNQDIDSIMDILSGPAFTDRNDDQRSSLGNKKA